jgi:hypothetical protein
MFEKHPSYPLELSLRTLQTDDMRRTIAKVLANKKNKAQTQRMMAGAFSEEELQAELDESGFVNIEEVKNSFVASGRELLDFLLQYPLEGEHGFEERLTLYCQLVTLFPDEIILSENYGVKGGVEYAMAFPAGLKNINH